MKTTYELLYIVPGQFTDEEIVPIMEQIATILTETGAEVGRHENLGRIKMAYQIKKIRNGSYVLAYFTAEPAIITEIDRRFRLTDEILRHIICIPSKGAETRVYDITSYTAPLTDEGRSTRGPKRSSKKSEDKTTETAPAASEKAAPSVDPAVIDKKVDELLETDIVS